MKIGECARKRPIRFGAAFGLGAVLGLGLGICFIELACSDNVVVGRGWWDAVAACAKTVIGQLASARGWTEYYLGS